VSAAWTSGWKAGNPSACARLARSGRGHRPCQSVPLPLFQPGGQSPRPAPAPPPARASPPPGRALASTVPGPAGLQGTVARGRGERGSRFLIPPGRTFSRMSGISGRGHRPCHCATLPLVQPGAQSPRPAPAPPLAGASRPPGRAQACVAPGPAGLRAAVPHGRGKRGAFPDPARRVKALSPLQWQGPSPLPQGHAGIRTSQGPKPQACARPATGGRFPPAGSGAGLRSSRTCRSAGHRSVQAGESLSPDRKDFPGRQAVGLLFQHPASGVPTPRFPCPYRAKGGPHCPERTRRHHAQPKRSARG